MWIWVLLDDVCSDMSRFHGIRDITALDGPTFFKLAYRLPIYDGAVKVGIEMLQKEREEDHNADLMSRMYDTPVEHPGASDAKAEPGGHVMTGEELLAAGPPRPELGEFVPIFDYVKCT
jgi:hypothetical protein